MRYLSPRADLSSKSQWFTAVHDSNILGSWNTSGDLRHFGFAWGEGNGPSSVGLWIAQLQLCTKSWCRCRGRLHHASLCVSFKSLPRFMFRWDVFTSFRAALLRFRKVRRCNLSLTKTMTYHDTVSISVVRYYQAEKLSTSGVQAWWTIERALSAPCAAPLCTSLLETGSTG